MTCSKIPASASSSHQTSTEPLCSTSPDSSPPPVPAAGHSNLPPVAPTFSPHSTHSKSTAKLPTSPPTQSNPASILPLREVAGSDGLFRIHVPVSLSQLSQKENRLGSYTSNPSAFIKEFQCTTQPYS